MSAIPGPPAKPPKREALQKGCSTLQEEDSEPSNQTSEERHTSEDYKDATLPTSRRPLPEKPPRQQSLPNSQASMCKISSSPDGKRPVTSPNLSNILPRSAKPSDPIFEKSEDQNTIKQDLILSGELAKRNREGKFDHCQFVLTATEIIYSRSSNLTETEDASSSSGTTIPLSSVIVTALLSTDYTDSEKRNRAFRFLSKHKSFILRAKTVELKDEWFTAIDTASKNAQKSSGLLINEADLAPIWSLSESNSCHICHITFGFFVRKHHCRNCGVCVCEPCSKDKVRILKLDPVKLFKVCNPCGAVFKEARHYGAAKLEPSESS